MMEKTVQSCLVSGMTGMMIERAIRTRTVTMFCKDLHITVNTFYNLCDRWDIPTICQGTRLEPKI